MLKPGGQTFNLFFSETPSDEAFDNMFNHPKWSSYENERHASPYYRNPKILEIYKKCIEDAGFEDCVVDTHEYVHHYSCAREYQGLWFLKFLILRFSIHRFTHSIFFFALCLIKNSLLD